MNVLAEIKGINRINDYAFKRIFGSEEGKEALLGFLNAVLRLPPGRELTGVELLDREIDPKHLLDRGARLDALEAWMMYLNNLEGEEMEVIAMDNPGIKKALTIEQAFWQSKKERRLYELREKAIRDEISALAGARAEGKAEGRGEGQAESHLQVP